MNVSYFSWRSFAEQVPVLSTLEFWELCQQRYKHSGEYHTISASQPTKGRTVDGAVLPVNAHAAVAERMFKDKVGPSRAFIELSYRSQHTQQFQAGCTAAWDLYLSLLLTKYRTQRFRAYTNELEGYGCARGYVSPTWYPYAGCLTNNVAECDRRVSRGSPIGVQPVG